MAAAICIECRRGPDGCTCPASIRTLPTPQSEAEQVDALEPYFQLAVSALVGTLDPPTDSIISRGRGRLRAGHAMYGDQLFTKPTEALMQDVYEELADAVVYTAELLRRAEHKAGA